MLKVVRGPVELRSGVGTLRVSKPLRTSGLFFSSIVAHVRNYIPDLRLKKSKSRPVGSRAA
jgi:hypothetical protein